MAVETLDGGATDCSSSSSSENAYHIYASNSGQSSSDKAQVLPDKIGPGRFNIDAFVGKLKNKELVLSSKPAAGEQSTTPLDSSDEWLKWLTEIDTPTTKIEVVAAMPKTEGETIDIKSFKITLNKPGEGLVFSSAPDVLSFGFDPSRVPASGLISTDSENQILLCGLNPSSPAVTTSVKALFEFVGLETIVKGLPNELPGIEAKLEPAKVVRKRNALWFDANTDYRTTCRLEFTITGDALTKFEELLKSGVPDFKIGSLVAVARRQVTAGQTASGQIPVEQGKLIFSLDCTIQPKRKPEIKLAAGIEFNPNTALLTLKVLTRDALARTVEWLAGLVGIQIDIVDWLQKNTNVFSHFQLHRITLALDTSVLGKTTVSAAWLHVEVDAKIGKSSNDESVVFLLMYGWNRRAPGFGTFIGSLWNDLDVSATGRDLFPTYEEWEDIRPLTKNISNKISLKKLIPGETIQDVPAGIPTDITALTLILNKTGLGINATLAAEQPPQGDFPQLYLGQIKLRASFSWGQTNDFQLAFRVLARIKPATTAKHQVPAYLIGQLEYKKSISAWALHGEINGLYASCLYSFFDKDSQDHVSALVDSIQLKSLTVDYLYQGKTGDKPAKGSEFTIRGALQVASLQLDLNFHFDSGGWNFDAGLGAIDKAATIGDILTSLTNVTKKEDLGLPELVTDTPFTGKPGDDKGFLLKIKKDSAKDKNALYFTANMAIGSATLTFTQYRSLDWEATVASKRFVKAAITALPKIEVPLVGDITQPFDEMFYMWAQDKSKKNAAAAGPGFTRAEVELLNGSLGHALVFKDDFKANDKGEKEKTDVVLPAGSHFVVVIKTQDDPRKVILDYVFMKPDPNASNSGNRSAIISSGEEEAADDSGAVVPKTADTEKAADTDGSSSHAPFKKKTGPLSISNIGLKYVNKKVEVMFDATFELGPVGFSLLGFKLNLTFTSLDSVPHVKADIEGLAASFDRPPLTIAGIIRHGKVDNVEYYAGGMIIGFKAYQFEAAGFYGIAESSGITFHPIFVFARLRGPLVTLEFAEISGVTGGFGYRTDIRMPTVQEVTDFPFVSERDAEGGDSPLETLQKLIDPSGAGWFTPNQPGKPETYWGAVGLKVDAFQMVSLDAVVVAEFGAGLKLGLFAVALADIPNKDSPIKFAHIELGIACVLDVDYGLFKAEAQLSPNSYIFDESCHLTGGFALYYWFDGPNADKNRIGDWVFTVGGYHQAYDIPVGYPRPDRLAISWRLGSEISIRGEAYFAITPKVCMGGGRLHALFSTGPLEAFFDVFADFLINYKPFHFQADASISVGVRYNIDFLFIHTHISVELGAQLYLWGPPMAGYVRVNFWIVSFDTESKTDSNVMAITVEETAENEVRPDGEAHTFSCLAGLLNPDDKNTNRHPKTPWIVRGGTFKCLISCKVAIRGASFGELDKDGEKINDPKDAGTINDVFAKPMKLEVPMFQSSLRVTVTQQDETPEEKKKHNWLTETSIKAVPSGLWGIYDKDSDPTGKGNHVDSILSATDSSGAIPLRMGVVITAPQPELSQDRLEKFNADKSLLQDIEAKDSFPTLVGSNRAWEPEAAPENPKPEQWEEVHKLWKDPEKGRDAQAGFVNLWGQTFGWSKGKQLNSGIPKRLDLKFDNSYIAAPLVTVAAA
ncbi:hypothetical protein BDD12DRAFT_892287 [Trichophaea hybrida]|nr:hypothetical protein BDD12DRAFT_892287 [Trichophaea hybrida]